MFDEGPVWKHARILFALTEVNFLDDAGNLFWESTGIFAELDLQVNPRILHEVPRAFNRLAEEYLKRREYWWECDRTARTEAHELEWRNGEKFGRDWTWTLRSHDKSPKNQGRLQELDKDHAESIKSAKCRCDDARAMLSLIERVHDVLSIARRRATHRNKFAYRIDVGDYPILSFRNQSYDLRGHGIKAMRRFWQQADVWRRTFPEEEERRLEDECRLDHLRDDGEYPILHW